MDMGGCVWIGESFLWNDKWQIKLLSELLSNSHSTFYEWFKQEIMTFRVSKFTNGYEGICMNRGKFLKELQVTDKIIEWIVFQFTFNHLPMTQTQEIINHRVSKIHEWIWGDVFEWGKVS